MKTGFVGLLLLVVLLGGCAGPQDKSSNPALRLGRPLRVPSPAGPSLTLDYGRSEQGGNRMAEFMYFVPLISPEPVSMQESPGNQQRTRVLPSRTRIEGGTFFTTCEFVISGTGKQENIFDLSGIIQRNQTKLKAGEVIDKQLTYITVSGPGHGCVEVEGTITNHVPVVEMVRLRFEGFGQPSPVSIGLEDIRLVNERVRHENQTVAQVESLTFRRTAGQPKMEVTVGTVKRADAGNGLWQNILGNVTGVAANLLIKPLPVERIGYQTMLDFGLALATEQPRFTFPRARNLKMAGQNQAEGN